MTFVRWHYRDGVYVRSHYRHTRPTAGAAQTTLLPHGRDTAPPRHGGDPAPRRSGRRVAGSRRAAAGTGGGPPSGGAGPSGVARWQQLQAQLAGT